MGTHTELPSASLALARLTSPGTAGQPAPLSDCTLRLRDRSSSVFWLLTNLLHVPSLEAHSQDPDSALEGLPCLRESFPLRAQPSVSDCGVSLPTGPADSPAPRLPRFWEFRVAESSLPVVLCKRPLGWGRQTSQRRLQSLLSTCSSCTMTRTPPPSRGGARAPPCDLRGTLRPPHPPGQCGRRCRVTWGTLPHSLQTLLESSHHTVEKPKLTHAERPRGEDPPASTSRSQCRPPDP